MVQHANSQDSIIRATKALTRFDVPGDEHNILTATPVPSLFQKIWGHVDGIDLSPSSRKLRTEPPCAAAHFKDAAVGLYLSQLDQEMRSPLSTDLTRRRAPSPSPFRVPTNTPSVCHLASLTLRRRRDPAHHLNFPKQTVRGL